MPTKRSKTTILAATLAGLTLAGGVAAASGGIATASPVATPGHQVVSLATTSHGDSETSDGPDEAAIKGTIKAPTENGEQNDKAEAAALQALTKVTAADAQKAATQAVPGTAMSTTVADADGWVVYEVTVKDAKGTQTEVTVDAGNGTVLTKEAADAETNDDHGGVSDSAEQSETPDTPAAANAPSSPTGTQR